MLLDRVRHMMEMPQSLETLNGDVRKDHRHRSVMLLASSQRHAARLIAADMVTAVSVFASLNTCFPILHRRLAGKTRRRVSA
jgi:hypothetical protein